jgi:hypothetical protein
VKKWERKHLSALHLFAFRSTVLGRLLVTRLGLDVLVVDGERLLNLVAKCRVITNAISS